MRYPFLVLLMIIFGFSAQAAIFKVGVTRFYQSPNELYLADVVQDGDTIDIDGNLYAGVKALAVWSKNNLLIRGVGGQPDLHAAGQNIQGKGIWVLKGNNITVENIQFSGAEVPDKNGAGIRLDGDGLTVRHCYFFDNENGILTSNSGLGVILIEYSEFEENGYGDGFSHNIYIGHVQKLIFQFNYSHHAVIGHNLKSRATENYILYNRIMDEQLGASSRLVDLPNGGFTVMMGNLFMQSNSAQNNNLVGYGLEGLSNPAPHELYFVNNTLVNKRQASCIFLDIKNGTAVVKIENNIFAGSGTLVNGTTTSMDNNLVELNIAALEFVDESNYDYHLKSTSPAIDFGKVIDPVNGYSLIPNFSYLHLVMSELRAVVNGKIDVGAYEYGTATTTNSILLNDLMISPNPARSIVEISIDGEQVQQVSIFDFAGQVLFVAKSNFIDVSALKKGQYLLMIQTNSGKKYTGSILKQ